MSRSDEVDASVPDFLRGGGEMGARIRAFDWESTPLGEPTTWPVPLRIAVRLMLSTNHPMYIFWGSDLICLYNDAYSESVGPEKHPGMLGRPAHEPWDEIWVYIGPQIEHVMAGKGSTWHENHLVPITRHGRLEEVYWTYSYSPIDDATAENGVGGVLVLCTETTEQVQAQERLKAAQQRWRQLFDQAPGFMCMLTGPDHVFEFANPAYFDLIGLNDIIGKPVSEALPFPEINRFIEELDRVYETGIPFRARSASFTYSHDEEREAMRYLDFVYQPIRSHSGEIEGIFVQGSDVTDRKEAEQALQDMDKRKDEFLATLAHELRNPLSPIQTGIEVMRMDRLNPDTIDHSLGMMERQISHLVRLVDDLLDISRISLGKMTLRLEDVDVSEAIVKAIETSSGAIHAEDRQVCINMPEDKLVVRADMVRLVQVISNLLTNASRHTCSKGRIWITGSRARDEVEISVRDDGAGVEPQMLDRLFDMFMQVSTNGGNGLGIGLALVSKLVRLHGGTVEARSAGLGQGSEFIVHLPLQETSEELVMIDKEQAGTRLDGRRVMVVDDNEDAARSLGMLLELLGAEVHIANSGASALSQMETFTADMVLLDLGMPDMDGYEVARRIRRLPGGERLLLIAVTGWGQEEVRERVSAAGFDQHLVKPMSLKDLENIIAKSTLR